MANAYSRVHCDAPEAHKQHRRIDDHVGFDDRQAHERRYEGEAQKYQQPGQRDHRCR
ncbi:hypothetical protein [Escherichia coli]|uniref:hypothetical protein n=1 Tax=Escherichia coli TaxID=562 RepID=UPI00388E3AF2